MFRLANESSASSLIIIVARSRRSLSSDSLLPSPRSSFSTSSFSLSEPLPPNNSDETKSNAGSEAASAPGSAAGSDAGAEAAAGATPAEGMDVNQAIAAVLAKALAHDGLSRGLNEAARALERGSAQLAVLADDCDQPDIKKLVEALCAEHNVSLLSVPESKQLGQWAGLCKLDAEGEPRKVVGCSCAVVTDYGDESEGLTVLQEYLKNR